MMPHIHQFPFHGRLGGDAHRSGEVAEVNRRHPEFQSDHLRAGHILLGEISGKDLD